MTETTQSFATSPRLERPRDAAIKGVCAALARTTGTDLVLWRVLFVVLTFFGGLGIVLYLAGIVAIPEEGQEHSIADRLFHGPDRHLSRGQLVLVVLLVATAAGLVKDTDGILTVAVLGGLALLWWRGRSDHPRPAAAPAAEGVATTPPTASPTSAPSVTVPWTPPPSRPRSPLVGITASLALLVAGALLLLGASGQASIPAEVVLAAALGVVGVGLVAGSFLGRSPGLVALAILLGLGLAGTAAVRPVVDAGVGDRSWRPVAASSYRLGVGEATLDLRDLPPRETGTIDIDARVDVGHLLVLVPDGLRVSLDATARLGDVKVLGSDTNGQHVDKHADLGPPGTPQVRLNLSVRTGLVEVRRG
ncbi:MAG: PspC domain protein [Frankiales bacterium]|nr:PspC domain protein [Frankiales bacterium]